jgi:hypothetical protein
MDPEHRPSDDESGHEAAPPEEPEQGFKPEEPRGRDSVAPSDNAIAEQPATSDTEAGARQADTFTDHRPIAQEKHDEPPRTDVEMQPDLIETNDQPARGAGRVAPNESAVEDEQSSLDVPPDMSLVDRPVEPTTSEIATPPWTGADFSTFDATTGDGVDAGLGPQTGEEPANSSSADSQFSVGDDGASQFGAGAIDPGFYVGGFGDPRMDSGFYLGGCPDSPSESDDGHVRDLLHRWNEQKSGRLLRQLSDSDATPTNAGVADSAADLSPRSQALLDATSDGGPPLARPIVLVRQLDEQLQKMIEDALAAVAARDAKTVDEVAEAKVDHAFWVRACQERAVWR